MGERELDVSQPLRANSLLPVRLGIGSLQRIAEFAERLCRDSGEKPTRILEMMTGSGRRNACPPRGFAEREAIHAPLGDHRFRSLDQRLAKGSVMIGAASGNHLDTVQFIGHG